MNKVLLMGNLTRDVEVRTTPGNHTVAGFSIAVNERWKDKSGEQKETVAFIDCEAWDKTGENIAKFFNKGSRIIVEGKLRQDTWTDKTDGSKRSKLKVNVETFHFVDRAGDGKKAAAPVAPRPVAQEATGVGEDDIPFAPDMPLF